MAQSEKIKKIHQQQVESANKHFEEYKEFIVKHIVDKFGKSYQTVDTIKDTWRSDFDLTPEMAAEIEEKTRLFFIVMLPEQTEYYNPRFLRELIRKITEYLSVYYIQKNQMYSRNSVNKKLFELFFENNAYIQKRIQKFQIAKNRERAKIKKKKASQEQIHNQKSKVELAPEQELKMDRKRLRIQTNELKKAIAKVDLSMLNTHTR